MTHAELLEGALRCTTEAEAEAFLAATVEKLARPGRNMAVLRATLLSNLGYMAGETDAETAARLFRLFRTTHPVYGDNIPWGDAT